MSDLERAKTARELKGRQYNTLLRQHKRRKLIITILMISVVIFFTAKDIKESIEMIR